MCLVTFSIQPGTRHPLVVAANRDESRSRPSAPVSIWPPSETDFNRAAASVVVAGGRDLQAGGTWLGVASNGRFAALTNFPPSDNAEPAPLADRMSRGTLCKDFLEGAMLAVEYAATVAERFHQFDGFNLVVHDGTGDGVIVYCTNRGGDDGKGYTRVLERGVYGMANAELLREPEWPKVRQTKARLEALCQTPESIVRDALFEIMSDTTQPPDTDLPQRGHPVEVERRLAPCFIFGSEYGTVNSTAVVFDSDTATISISERTFCGPGASMSSTVDVSLPLVSRPPGL